MGYWMHVYSRSDEVMEVEEIRAHFEIEGEPVVVASDPGVRGAAWKELLLTHTAEYPITQIYLRTGPALAGSVKGEIERVRSALPSCNAEWLIEFLQEVKAVYAFQILSGTDVGDGWRFIERCREHPDCRRVPILVISAFAQMPETEERMRRLNVATCLAKPFDLGDVVHQVDHLLRPRQQRAAA